MLWLDAYQHEKRGHPNFPSATEVPFQEIYALVKGLQPNCLVLRHPGMAMYDTEYTDVQVWEGVFTHEATHAFWEQYMEEHPEGVQEVCEVLQPGWFWKKIMPERPVKSVDYIIGNLKTCNANNANYLPNSAVNRRGLLDDNLVSRLKEVGKAIEEQGVFDEHKEE
jgi:alpha-L-fucosidase